MAEKHAHKPSAEVRRIHSKAIYKPRKRRQRKAASDIWVDPETGLTGDELRDKQRQLRDEFYAAHARASTQNSTSDATDGRK